MCSKCGKPLSKDEIALYKKMICKTATEYLCIGCLADYMQVPREALEKKISEYKEMGCTLFV